MDPINWALQANLDTVVYYLSPAARRKYLKKATDEYKKILLQLLLIHVFVHCKHPQEEI